MQGVTFKELRKISQMGYRIVEKLRGNCWEVCTIFEKKDTKQEREVLEIFSFNRMGKLRIRFAKQGEEDLLVEWISILPKSNLKGIILLYQENGLTLGKEIIVDQ